MILERIPLAEGTELLTIRDARFHTARLSVTLFLPLSAETATAYALLPELLSHASAAYPDMTQLSRRLCALYGAGLSSSVASVGDCQMLTLTVSCIDNRFCLDGEDAVGACGELLADLLLCPHLAADGLFDETDFLQEKRCLCERIAAEVNDKGVYARHRLSALLGNGEGFGVPFFGDAEKAAALTRKTATDAWHDALRLARIQFFYTAADDGPGVAALLKKRFLHVKRQPCALSTVPLAVDAVRRGEERMAVEQAKLVMGFSVGAHEPHKADIAAARLTATLFGGSEHSLLFRHVREEMSLCYYCSATLNRVKGMITVHSGVDAADVGRAEKEILRQLARMQAGDFSDDMLEAARRRLVGSLRENEDLQSSLFSWYRAQALYPPFVTPAEAIRDIEKVTREQVVAMANTVRLCGVFTLLPEETA